MNNSLDISIHGPQRVAIIERLVHICRYSPGLVLLDGDDGRSPVKFLRHMADLLRDELDFALLDGNHFDASQVAKELVLQWFIYQEKLGEHSEIQSVHHFLDVGLQSGRLALVIVERAFVLSDEAIDCLISMMARHSRLTVFFAGIDDTRSLLRRAQQLEVPVHYIELSAPIEVSRPSPSYQPDLLFSSKIFDETNSGRSGRKVDSGLFSSGFDHSFSDESYELPDEEPDDFFESDFLVAEVRGRREPSVRLQQTASNGSAVLSDVLGAVSDTKNRIYETQKWGAATWADIRTKRYGVPILICGSLILAVLLSLVVLNLRKSAHNQDISTLAIVPVEAVNPPLTLTNEPPPVVGVALPVSGSSTVTSQKVASVTESSSKQEVVVHPSVAAGPVVKSKPLPHVSSGISVTSKKISASEKIVSSSKLTSGSEKVWRSKPDNFTIQMAAAYGEENIKLLQAKLPDGQPHYIFQTKREGKPWFILVYGSFSSKQQASAASESLPTEIKKNAAPWVRKQSEVFSP